MEVLTALLGAALLAALWWVFRLRRQVAELPARTAEPQAADSLRPLFDAAAVALDAGLLILDGDRRVRYLNPQAHELLGLNPSAGVGQGLITLLRDYQVDAFAAAVLADGQPREHVLAPGLYGRTLRLRLTRFTTDEAPGLVILMRDVTQLSMLERARRDMVANVSHELRTPLASVKLLVETLQTNPPPQIASRMLGQMSHEVDAITQLVDELHDLSQIESGRVILQMIAAPLAPIVERALERLRQQADLKMITLEAHVPDLLPSALVDRDRIGQVLLNLLHNAIKFTPEGGKIVVGAQAVSVDQVAPAMVDVERRQASVALAQQGRPPIVIPSGHSAGEWLVVSVTDTGIGIPGGDLPRIFERFYKVDRARTRHSGGTGLGLAIAKHLIEGHGGRIWAISSEGDGSAFFFTLPVAYSTAHSV